MIDADEDYFTFQIAKISDRDRTRTGRIELINILSPRLDICEGSASVAFDRYQTVKNF